MKKMKKIFVLLMLSASVLVSCNSDDDKVENKGTLIGKWEFFEVSLQGTEGEFIPYYQHFGDSECGIDIWEFNSNYSAQNVFFRQDNEHNCYSEENFHTYSFSEENINLIYEEITISAKIEFLTNGWLKIIFTESILFKTYDNLPIMVDGFTLKK